MQFLQRLVDQVRSRAKKPMTPLREVMERDDQAIRELQEQAVKAALMRENNRKMTNLQVTLTELNSALARLPSKEARLRARIKEVEKAISRTKYEMEP